MAESTTWVPDGIDLDRPSAARLYDYLLGGGHNFAHDRELAERFLKAQPHAREIARHNRSFLRRAVLFMAGQGIRQFLDLGSGIPTVGNVHAIAQAADPTARVVYVDYEEVAFAHSHLMLADNPNATIVQADLTDPDAVLGAAETRALLDFDQPIGLIMAGVFHFVPPRSNPAQIVARYRDATASGSWLAFSQFTRDLMPEEMDRIVEVMKSSRDPMFPRSRDEIAALFEGYELVEPGIVPTALWHPDQGLDDGDDPNRAGILSGVGRKN
ncbi:SAM-dependent methyltransferase [Alloactinosynnema sp. L-07]|uniref:SAM-dependent methyltransferase n=1 Tax=Alloactinosynnema sp. L-07 TaxID=1653480 RepID=UPI0006B49027|nr:SAM-dependent methyltransferase [Alloactinosynnema sp. L-07]